MWKGFNPTIYDRADYAAYVGTLPAQPWVKYLVLHNTAAPSLEQWLHGGASEKQRLTNLQSYYENELHWHAGPHAFISPAHICGFSDPTQPGVHASCFNSASLGFEMVGDYDSESFTSGPGADVRDNTVFCLATWYKKLGLRPDDYSYGVKGLHFHKDCKPDHHDCPGKNVDRDDLIQRILAEMGEA
jgi:hypothetical protein